MEKTINIRNKKTGIIIICIFFMIGRILCDYAALYSLKNAAQKTFDTYKGALSQMFSDRGQTHIKVSRRGNDEPVYFFFDKDRLGFSTGEKRDFCYTLTHTQAKEVLECGIFDFFEKEYEDICKYALLLPGVFGKTADFSSAAKKIASFIYPAPFGNGEKISFYLSLNDIEAIIGSVSCAHTKDNSIFTLRSNLCHESYAFFEVYVTDEQIREVQCTIPSNDVGEYSVRVFFEKEKIRFGISKTPDGDEAFLLDINMMTKRKGISVAANINHNTSVDGYYITLAFESDGDMGLGKREKNIYSLTVGELLAIGGSNTQ